MPWQLKQIYALDCGLWAGLFQTTQTKPEYFKMKSYFSTTPICVLMPGSQYNLDVELHANESGSNDPKVIPASDNMRCVYSVSPELMNIHSLSKMSGI